MTAKWVCQMKRLCFQNIFSSFREELKASPGEGGASVSLGRGSGPEAHSTITWSHTSVVEMFLFVLERGFISPSREL